MSFIKKILIKLRIWQWQCICFISTSHDNNDKNDSFSETLFAVPVSLLVFIFLVIPVILVMNSALYLTK